MRGDLFAGLPVADYRRSLAWYERFLGSKPSFLPTDGEAVWELADHRFLYIVERPQDAGHAMHTVFVDDLDALVAQIAGRGIEPAKRETYSNGVSKTTYHDPDGNEIGLGGAPPSAADEQRTPAVQTVQLDNDRVRVSEWRFAPGAATGHHRHEFDYVVVPLATGSLILEEAAGQREAQLVSGQSYYRAAGVEHDVINPNSGEFAFIEIEFKAP
jgi:quercetin dioxygenase-like cupin family protein